MACCARRFSSAMAFQSLYCCTVVLLLVSAFHIPSCGWMSILRAEEGVVGKEER